MFGKRQHCGKRVAATAVWHSPVPGTGRVARHAVWRMGNRRGSEPVSAWARRRTGHGGAPATGAHTQVGGPEADGATDGAP